MDSPASKPLARVRLHPFLIVMGALMLGTSGGGSWPRGIAPGLASLLEGLGGVVRTVGIAILVFAYGAMALRRTTINPSRPTRAVVTSGVYRLSRNPIYLGWFAVLFGNGLAIRNLADVGVSLAMIVLLHWAVVLPEERYLEATFGDEYLSYKKRVRRWI